MNSAVTLRQLAIKLGAQPTAEARRTYWRTLAAIAVLDGHRWPEAERLGAEP